MGHGAGYPGQQRGCVQPGKALRFMVSMFLCSYGPEMKRFPCSFVKHPPYPECTPPLPFLLSFRPILHVVPLGGHWVSQGWKEGIAVWFWLGGECSKKVLWFVGGLCMICQIEAAWTEEIPLEIGSGSARRKVSGKLWLSCHTGQGGRTQWANGCQHWLDEGLCHEEVWSHTDNNCTTTGELNSGLSTSRTHLLQQWLSFF